MFTQKQLHVFHAVMSTGSVSAAARRINLSQPSVSRILADLERQIGCPLFQRKSKGLDPTPEAVTFLEAVERHYLALAEIEEIANQIARKERGHLTFATMTAASLEIVPLALAQMGLSAKNISVSSYVQSSLWVIDYTRSGTINTGVACVTDLPKGMRILYEVSVPHMCVLSPDHPLASSETPCALDDLDPWRVVGLIGSVAEELTLRRDGSDARPFMTAETSIAALNMALHCDAIAVTDALTAHYWMAQHGGTARIISDLPEYRVAIFEPVGTSASMIDREFQSAVIDQIERIRLWAETAA